MSGTNREIERKFLVVGDAWRGGSDGLPIRQGYIFANPERSVRVRVHGDRALLTIKGSMPSDERADERADVREAARDGLIRAEFEYQIPVADAEEMLESFVEGALIEKTRYDVEHAGLWWTVDVFSGENEGLILAEVELETVDQEVVLPPWVGEEVTGDARYVNASLVNRPYAQWR